MLPEVSEARLPFSKDQVKDLLGVAENEWRGTILLGYHTGIRLSDAANLTCMAETPLDAVDLGPRSKHITAQSFGRKHNST
jgi:hypothetical protein